MYLVCWHLCILPTVTPGVDCAFKLCCRYDKALPWIVDRRIANQHRQHLQILEDNAAVSSNFGHKFRKVQQGKNWYSEAPSNSHSNASKIKNFEDPSKELWQKYWRARVLKSARDRLQPRSKKGITLLFGSRFGQMMTRWKNNFECVALEQKFNTHSVLEVQEKFVQDEATTKDNKGRGDDGVNNDWGHSLTTMRKSWRDRKSVV